MSLSPITTGEMLIKLQPILECIECSLEQLQSKWSSHIFPEIERKELTAFDFYPFLFWDAFPTIGVKDIELLSLAGSLLVRAIVLYDRVMDRVTTKYLGTLSALRLQAMQIESYNLLHQLFPASATFWQYFNRYFQEYADACWQEQCFASGEYLWEEYTPETAFKIMKGKNGIARVAIAGLVELAGDDCTLEPLTESIDSFNIANQIWDDLCDWKEDLINRTPSLLLVELCDRQSPHFNELEFSNIQKQFARDIYYKGHAKSVLDVALQELDRAEDCTAGIEVPLWRSAIQNLRRKCQELQEGLQQTVQRNLTRIQQQPDFRLELPHSATQWQKVAGEALQFTVSQWRLGFGEAQHVMYLPPEIGFSSNRDYHSSDIFQRALIADTVSDANRFFDGKLQLLLDYEIQYLINSRLTSGVGGWSYFPSVPEIAADADDLAQVMQVLLGADRAPEVVKYCELPLSVLLSDRVRSDGSIETWIIPATDLTPQQQRQVEFNETKWGTGPDNEVMANLLYALHLYDGDRFADIINAGIRYLESQQEADGSWTSKWYYGQYYGTYACLRLLTAAKSDSEAIAAATDFLKTTQHLDGGWGMTEDSDALTTSLALLGLATAQPDTFEMQRAEKALIYLQKSQIDGEYWSSIPFIRPKASAPYGSKTITTAYVLKAALAWHLLTREQHHEDAKIREWQYSKV